MNKGNYLLFGAIKKKVEKKQIYQKKDSRDCKI